MPQRHAATKVLFLQARPAKHPMTAHEAECLRRRLSAGAITLTTRSLLEESPSRAWLDDMDAVIIGGSGSLGVNDASAQRFIPSLRRLLDTCLARSIPGFGICFGHQVLGLHLGASVASAAAQSEQGTVDYHSTEVGKADPIFARLGPQFRGHTGHADHVAQVPAGVELLAQNDTLSTQAFRVRGAPFYSTQFHPDLTAAEARLRYRACGHHLAKDSAELERQAMRFDTSCTDTVPLLDHFLRTTVPALAQRRPLPLISRRPAAAPLCLEATV